MILNFILILLVFLDIGHRFNCRLVTWLWWIINKIHIKLIHKLRIMKFILGNVYRVKYIRSTLSFMLVISVKKEHIQIKFQIKTDQIMLNV